MAVYNKVYLQIGSVQWGRWRGHVQPPLLPWPAAANARRTLTAIARHVLCDRRHHPTTRGQAWRWPHLVACVSLACLSVNTK
jgi:hypothetical protein